jgi:hypothetical protein
MSNRQIGRERTIGEWKEAHRNLVIQLDELQQYKKALRLACEIIANREYPKPMCPDEAGCKGSVKCWEQYFLKESGKK